MAYVKTRDVGTYNKGSEIFVMEADGTNQVNLTQNGKAFFEYYPTWSPDGSQITFAAQDQFRAYPWQIYVMNKDGTDRIQITDGTFGASGPVWSPF